MGADPSTLLPHFVHKTQACLLPGDYEFLAFDRHEDGWEGGTFDVYLAGGTTPLVPQTEVRGASAWVRFTVPRAAGQYLVQLPASVPRDTTVAARAATGPTRLLIKTTGAAPGDPRPDPEEWLLPGDAAWETLAVTPPGAASLAGATLTVIAREASGDRLIVAHRFGAARASYEVPLARDCGPLTELAFVDASRCYHGAGHPCPLTCEAGFAGAPAATCGAGGAWTVAGACRAAVASYVMGSNREGQLGLEGRSDTAAPYPLVAPGDQPITALVFGHRHSAFEAGGKWYVMGAHADGQLGRATPGARYTTPPVPLEAPDGARITDVAMGRAHTAFLAGGQCYVMGANAFGELGLGTVERVDAPQRLVPPNGAPVTALALGAYHSAFRAGDDWYVVGRNDRGQLGLGHFQLFEATPRRVVAPNGARISAMALGGDHTAFVAGGQCFVMGANADGQLGLGHGRDQPAPQRLRIAGEEVVAVALGGAHSAYRAAAGRWYVAGRNDRGQLGLNHAVSQLLPQPLPEVDGGAVQQVALGHEHTAVLTAGQCYVMGANAHGQLGLGHRTDQTTPQPLRPPNGKRVSLVALGGEHSGFLADQTLSATMTPSGTPTPPGTLSPTATATATPVPTGTPSATPSPSAHATPSPSASPTHTPAATPSPSATGTPTRTATQTATPVPTASASPTPTATPTQSATPTMLPSVTPSATSTRTLLTCSKGAPGSTTGGFGIQSTGEACVADFNLGPGPSAMRSKSVLVRVLETTGQVTLRLDSGCKTDGGGCPFCDACTRQYTEADAGRSETLPLGSTSNVRLVLLYAPDPAPGAAGARFAPAAVGGFSMDVVLVSTASSLCVLVLALAVLLGLPVCTGVAWWHARRKAARPLSYGAWAKRELRRPRWLPQMFCMHPRWASPWVEAGLVAGLYLVVAGAVSYFVLEDMRDADASAAGPLITGLCLVGAGAMLLLVFGVRALRDDRAHECLVCWEPSSRWRFIGTYYPNAKAAPGEPAAVSKGHTRCMRCVVCARPVVLDRWLEGPAERLYHLPCWEAHCTTVCLSPSLAREWCQDPAVTDLERVHLLAGAIRWGNEESIAAVLEVCPELRSHQLPGVPSARHFAAAAGRAETLRTLLDGMEGCLEEYSPAGGDRYSLHISRLRPAQNDTYVRQDPLQYNGRAVYVGHTHGLYLYYYEPSPGRGQPKHEEGWCLSGHLGSGAPTFRLCLDTPPAPPLSDDDEPPPTLKKGMSKMWGSFSKSLTKTASFKKARSKKSSTDSAFESVATDFITEIATPSPPLPEFEFELHSPDSMEAPQVVSAFVSGLLRSP